MHACQHYACSLRIIIEARSALLARALCSWRLAHGRLLRSHLVQKTMESGNLSKESLEVAMPRNVQSSHSSRVTSCHSMHVGTPYCPDRSYRSQNLFGFFNSVSTMVSLHAPIPSFQKLLSLTYSHVALYQLGGILQEGGGSASYVNAIAGLILIRTSELWHSIDASKQA